MPLPDLKDFKKVNVSEIDKLLLAKEYFKELKNGSFKQEYLDKISKQPDMLDSLTKLTAWTNKKFNECQNELNRTKDGSKEQQYVQLKAMMYMSLANRARIDIYNNANFGNKHFNPNMKTSPEVSKAKSEYDKAYIRSRDDFRVFETGMNDFASLTEEIETKYPNDVLDGVNKRIGKSLDNKISDAKEKYRSSIGYNVRHMEDSLNKMFSIDAEFSRESVEESLQHSSSIKMDNYKSITEMANAYKQNNYKELEASKVENESINNAISDIEEKAYNPKTKTYDLESQVEVSDSLNGARKELKENFKANMPHKMALYMAAKKEMDGRGMFKNLINNIFFRSRTKQEKATLAELRNDVKNSLNANDEYMDNLDKYIENKMDINQINNSLNSVPFKKFDYKDKTTAKVNEIESKILQDSVAELTSPFESKEKSQFIEEESIEKEIEEPTNNME